MTVSWSVLRVLRPLGRPRARLAAFRVASALLSVGLVLVLLSRSLPSSPDYQGPEPSPGGEVIVHPLVDRPTPLSAKERSRFFELNPVVSGWGDNGAPVYLDDSVKAVAEEQFKSGAFNVYISDRISPNRSLPDPRPYECSKVFYNLKSLGTATVVIIFTDEIWSALIRTIWSVWTRTPDMLLNQIILVDDWSSKKPLKEDLDRYCAFFFGNRVKIIRTQRREGLIRARIMGAKQSEGDVLVFLDSHCEVTEGWLQPLLATIRSNPSNVVCPVIDVIGDKALDYSVGNPYYFQVGGFTWSGHFTWVDIPEDETKNNPTSAVASPTMAGGLFAINKDYFFSMGAYDEAMEIWGGENLELSFRIWQCGGKLLIHPCSHVGHIFRDYHPYSFQGKDTHGINTLRTILVWMDPEYQKYFFMYRHDLKGRETGNLSKRLMLKKDLHCKSFRWYLENVFEGKKYIYDVDVKAYGFARNPMSNLCFDILNRDEEKTNPLGLFTCSPRPENTFTNQVFSYTTTGEIRREETCASADVDKGLVQMKKCIEVDKAANRRRRTVRLTKRKQLWEHQKGGRIVNVATRECITSRGASSMSDLLLAPCREDDMNQIWWFQTYADVTVSS